MFGIKSYIIVMIIIDFTIYIMSYIILTFLVQRCTWHLFTQEWNSIPRKDLSDDQKNVLKEMKRWIDSWITNVEHEYQFDHSFQSFKSHLRGCREVLGLATYKRVRKIVDSMECCSTKWAKCFKAQVLDLEQTTSSIGESANASMKRFERTSTMASRKLATSAETQIKHSNHLEDKRMNHIANDMNMNCHNVFMTDQNLLTSYCQTIFKRSHDRISHYHCVRDGEFEWLLCHKNTFVLNDNLSISQLRIGQPKYANVHRVVGDRDRKILTCRSHKTRARLGIPCTCVMAVLPFCDASLVNPRYVKLYNSWLYDSDPKVKTSIDALLSGERSMEPNHCNISNMLDHIPPYIGVVYGPDTSEAIYNKMKILEQMHMRKQIHLRGEDPPEEHLNSTGSVASSNVSFDEAIGYEGETQEEIIPCKDNTPHSTYEMYSYFESWQKDILKHIGNSEENFLHAKKVTSDLTMTILERNRKEMKQSQDMGHKLVSSHGETEKSPLQKRYKRGYERK